MLKIDLITVGKLKEDYLRNRAAGPVPENKSIS